MCLVPPTGRDRVVNTSMSIIGKSQQIFLYKTRYKQFRLSGPYVSVTPLNLAIVGKLLQMISKQSRGVLIKLYLQNQAAGRIWLSGYRGWWQIGVHRQQQRAGIEVCGLASGECEFGDLNFHSLLSKLWKLINL